MDTPLLFLIFNRPLTTAVVFEKIREQKPAKIYIAADGPRDGNVNDVKNCAAVKKLVIEGIDWDCEIKTLFRDSNIGCGREVSEAITWFFGHEEYGIILEDDTVPNASFFSFCTEMLRKFEDDCEIMHISGCYFLEDFLSQASTDYYFTKHIHVWGWATWKRAWISYNYDIPEWKTTSPSKMKSYFGKYSDFWNKIFDLAYDKQIDTWDYQWMFTVFNNDGIAINPTTNLISNIGFGGDATHTVDKDSIYNKIRTKALPKIKHPKKIKIDSKKDNLYYQHYLNVEVRSTKQRLKTFLCRTLKYLKG